MRQLSAFFRLTRRFHFWGSFAIMTFVAVVMAHQVTGRHDFASSELYDDVIERWGAPIVQPVPSVRYVESGSVFSDLDALPLSRQEVRIDAAMNYRKRGLTYFSGFDFTFRGAYGVHNGEGKTIDLVFVFPIQVSMNQVLLSDLDFRVNGEPQSIDLAETADRLVWTGRLRDGESLDVDIAFTGRGLDSLTYLLDPALPVRDFKLVFAISGGDHFDYDAGVVPATSLARGDGELTLTWEFASLESGVPVGVRLPSEKSRRWPSTSSASSPSTRAISSRLSTPSSTCCWPTWRPICTSISPIRWRSASSPGSSTSIFESSSRPRRGLTCWLLWPPSSSFRRSPSSS